MIRIAQLGQTWYVPSEADPNTEWIVHFKFHPLVNAKVWTCNCPNFTEYQQWHEGTCKHIDEVQIQYLYPRGPIDETTRVNPSQYARRAWFQRRPPAVESKLENALESLTELLWEIQRG